MHEAGIAVAVNSRNGTFGNVFFKVSTILLFLKCQAIHKVSQLPSSFELLTSTPCVYHHQIRVTKLSAVSQESNYNDH